MTCGIYCITHRESGRRYIGLSKAVERRWAMHKRQAMKNDRQSLIHRAIGKYGPDAFDFEVIEVCPVEKLSEREIHWISVFDSCATGFNLTDGGEFNAHSRLRPRVVSDLTRKKLSESGRRYLQSPEGRRQRSEQMVSRYASPEARLEQSIKIKAALDSPEARARRSAQAKLSAGTPEFRAKCAENMKRRYANPEARALQSAKLKAYWANKRQQERASA